MSKRMTWMLGIIATIIGGLTIFGVRWGVNFQVVHYAQANQTEALAEENEKKLAPIIELVEQLGKRQAAVDAAQEERAKLCRMGKLVDKEICGAAGVLVE